MRALLMHGVDFALIEVPGAPVVSMLKNESRLEGVDDLLPKEICDDSNVADRCEAAFDLTCG